MQIGRHWSCIYLSRPRRETFNLSKDKITQTQVAHRHHSFSSTFTPRSHEKKPQIYKGLRSQTKPDVCVYILGSLCNYCLLRLQNSTIEKCCTERMKNPRRTQMKAMATSPVAVNGLSTESGASESTELHIELLFSTFEFCIYFQREKVVLCMAVDGIQREREEPPQ